MRYGSVCSGIEAASLAWSPLGWTPAWFAEIEPFPSAVLAHRFPDVENLGDMTRLPSRVLSGSICAPDVLAGGTPCQSFSVAGMREGISDPRGALTIKFVELADAIDAVRVRSRKDPAIVIWENVPGVLSDKGNAFGCFLGALAGEDCELQPPGKRWTNAGCVYGPQRSIAWRVLDAQYFGLAQRRKRVFVVASARTDFDPAAVLFEREGMRRDSPPCREAEKDLAGTIEASPGRSRGAGTPPAMLTANPIVATLDASYGRLQGCSGQDANHGHSHLVVHGTQDPIIGNDCAHALGRNSGQENAVLSVALRGREGGATAELGGNVSGALRASSGGGDKPHVLERSTVRRLTPVECERLMGMPDNWTLIPQRKLNRLLDDELAYLRTHFPDMPDDEAHRLAEDGPRYKAIGNSMAAPVMAWIGRRIQMVVDAQKEEAA